MLGLMTELILMECMEKAQAKSNPAKPKIDNNVKIKLSNNAYGRTEDEDVVNHIAKVLKIYNLIKTQNMDIDRLRVHVFPFLAYRDDEDEGPDYIEFKAWLNSKFYNHKRMDGMTKSAFTDDIKSSDKEWEESYYGNPRNTNTDSFFKPYLDAQEKGNSYEIEK
ncbi:hypothetical protein Tco_1101900 [Tanacetum coccineum]